MGWGALVVRLTSGYCAKHVLQVEFATCGSQSKELDLLTNPESIGNSARYLHIFLQFPLVLKGTMISFGFVNKKHQEVIDLE